MEYWLFFLQGREQRHWIVSRDTIEEDTEVAWNFFFSEATNYSGSTRSPVRDHQHHTRAEGLRARSR